MKFIIAVLICMVAYAAALSTGVAVLVGTIDNEGITGTVTFTQTGTGNVTVFANISGLKEDGEYALHIHEFGDITNSTGTSTGGHYIGSGISVHGCPSSPNRHEGDMGSWIAKGGAISQEKELDLLQLTGEFSILGRSVVLHASVDSCESNFSSGRLAVGVIGIANVEGNTANQTVNGNLVCRLQTTTNCQACQGTVWFEKFKDAILVTARIEGLAIATVHGFHVHEFGDLTKSDGTGAGVHWNPTNANHGLPSLPDRHYGDMGNIQNFEGPVAWYQYTNTLIPSLSAITGRAVVVHLDLDHGRGNGCDAYGSAGSRVATCTIGYASSENQKNPGVSYSY